MTHDPNMFNPHEIVWTDENIRRLWDYYGSSSAHKTAYFGESVGAHFVRFIKRRSLLKQPATIVDFSCGTGAIIEQLTKHAAEGSSIYGCDPSRRSIEIAEARNRGRPTFKGVFHIQSFPTSIPSDSVDLLLLTEVVEHLDDVALESIISESKRILRPHGRLLVTTPNNENLEQEKVLCPNCGCVFHRWQHQRSWTSATLSESLRGFGFMITSTHLITWGNEAIDTVCRILRRKPSGLALLASKKL